MDGWEELLARPGSRLIVSPDVHGGLLEAARRLRQSMPVVAVHPALPPGSVYVAAREVVAPLEEPPWPTCLFTTS